MKAGSPRKGISVDIFRLLYQAENVSSHAERTEEPRVQVCEISDGFTPIYFSFKGNYGNASVYAKTSKHWS
jgi:hypothetical protein